LAASVKDDRATTYRRLKTRKKQTILTGDQHTEHTQTGQRVSRPDVLYFLPNRNFLKTILASRTSGTFGFAPTHKADPSAKPKEPLFSLHTDDNYKLDTNKMLKNMFNILHLLNVNFISLTH
jgi:hypothetical protein